MTSQAEMSGQVPFKTEHWVETLKFAYSAWLKQLELGQRQPISIADTIKAPTNWRERNPDVHANTEWPCVIHTLFGTTLDHFLPIARARLKAERSLLRFLPDRWLRRVMVNKVLPFMTMPPFLHSNLTGLPDILDLIKTLNPDEEIQQWIIKCFKAGQPEPGQTLSSDRLEDIARIYNALFTLDDLLAQEHDVSYEIGLEVKGRLLEFAVALHKSGFQAAQQVLGASRVEHEFRELFKRVDASLGDARSSVQPEQKASWWREFEIQFALHIAGALGHELTPQLAFQQFNSTDANRQPTQHEWLLQTSDLDEAGKYNEYLILRRLVSGMTLALSLDSLYRDNLFIPASVFEMGLPPALAQTVFRLIQECHNHVADIGGVLNDAFSSARELHDEGSLVNAIQTSMILKLHADPNADLRDELFLANLVQRVFTEVLTGVGEMVRRANEIAFKKLPELLAPYKDVEEVSKLLSQTMALVAHMPRNSYSYQNTMGMGRYAHPNSVVEEGRTYTSVRTLNGRVLRQVRQALGEVSQNL